MNWNKGSISGVFLLSFGIIIIILSDINLVELYRKLWNSLIDNCDKAWYVAFVIALLGIVIDIGVEEMIFVKSKLRDELDKAIEERDRAISERDKAVFERNNAVQINFKSLSKKIDDLVYEVKNGNHK